MSGAKHHDDAPSGAFEWDVFISCRKAETGLEYELARNLYAGLTDQSLRVFWEPICLPHQGDSALSKRDRELKYIKAAANSCMAVVIISRATFSGRGYDVTQYVWSSHPDDLLLEWDLLLELYDRGRMQAIVPCLMGDLLNSNFIKMQDRVMSKLGISRLDEKNVIARIREIFMFTDRDNSGFIDQSELRTTFNRFGLQVTERELKEMMAEAERDGDGGIDLFEFEDLILKLLEEKCGVIIRYPEEKADKKAELDDGEKRLLQIANAAKEKEKAKKAAQLVSELNLSDSDDLEGSDDEEQDEEDQEVIPIPAPDLQEKADGGRESYGNFWDSQIVPLLPPVLVVGAMRKVTLWLVHDLHMMATPVLWREPHMRAVPGLDGDGRTIEQTINCMLKFPFPHPHLVEGSRERVAEGCVAKVMDVWRDCVKIRFPPRRPGVKFTEQMCWVLPDKKANFKDPITRVPFHNMLAFHRLRQIYYFDVKKGHESILLEDYGTRATYSGQGGNSILLAPPISATGISYVEFNLEVVGQFAHLNVGVCDGTFDVRGGWTALSDLHSWLYSCYNGKSQHNGVSEDFGISRPKKGDRVGLLVDMSSGTLEVYINNVPQGILASGLPQPLFFVVDFGWPTQVLEIIPKDHWQMLSQCMQRFFIGLGPVEREAKMLELFSEIDLDGSGLINKEELTAAFERMHVFMAEQEMDDLINSVTAQSGSGSGEVDLDEFRVMVQNLVSKKGIGKTGRNGRGPSKADSLNSSPIAATVKRMGAREKVKCRNSFVSAFINSQGI